MGTEGEQGMKVQELINRLADFRADAEVVFWVHNEKEGIEYAMPISHIARDNNGTVGINWNEDGSACPVIEIPMTDE